MQTTLENVKAILAFFSVAGTQEEQQFCSGLLESIEVDETKEVDKMYDLFTGKEG